LSEHDIVRIKPIIKTFQSNRLEIHTRCEKGPVYSSVEAKILIVLIVLVIVDAAMASNP
jgi:hypothetical protein